jgi:hypothetical protein
MKTIQQHAMEAADMYRKLIQAAIDYPYRDWKDSREQFLQAWVFDPDCNGPDATGRALVEVEHELLGGFGKLPNFFPLGHPRN